MQKYGWLFFIIFLTACGGDSSTIELELPTLVPTIEIVPTTTSDAPRGPADTGLPPTFTPPPTAAVFADVNVGLGSATAEPGTPTPLPAGAQTYTIQRGDTVALIAGRFGITVDALVEANNIENIDRIEIGDVLVIPSAP